MLCYVMLYYVNIEFLKNIMSTYIINLANSDQLRTVLFCTQTITISIKYLYNYSIYIPLGLSQIFTVALSVLMESISDMNLTTMKIIVI